jgi:septin family protein
VIILAKEEKEEIKRQIRDLIEAYKVTLFLTKTFPENGRFRSALQKEKYAIKSLRFKLT